MKDNVDILEPFDKKSGVYTTSTDHLGTVNGNAPLFIDRLPTTCFNGIADWIAIKR
jgi:hypothetical protein